MGDRLDETKGNVKEGLGKLTGNRRVKAEGKSQAGSARAKRETKGALQEAGGSVKEGVGKLTGDRRTEAEGKTDQAKGDVKDAARDVSDTIKGVGDSLSNDDRRDRRP